MIRTRRIGVAAPLLAAAFAAVTAAQAGPARSTRVVPADTVVRAELDTKLSSKTAQKGDPLRAIVSDEDRSGFPIGTRFEGTVTEVQRAKKDQPGVLDVRFNRAVLPDGTPVALGGSLASLDDKDVKRSSDGRMVSKHGSKSKFDAKWVGYGAGAGAVLATVFGGGFLKGALIGALGGAAYSYINKDKNKDNGEYHDVDLAKGTPFGIRVDNRVSFTDTGRYRYTPADRDSDIRDRDRDR